MPRRDRVVDAGEQVLDLLVTPVGEDGARILRAAAGAAAIVDREHHVAVGREQLPLERRAVARQLERVVVLAVRAAVDPQDRRIAAPGDVVRRLDDLSVDLGAAAAFEA